MVDAGGDWVFALAAAPDSFGILRVLVELEVAVALVAKGGLAADDAADNKKSRHVSILSVGFGDFASKELSKGTSLVEGQAQLEDKLSQRTSSVGRQAQLKDELVRVIKAKPVASQGQTIRGLTTNVL